MWRFPIWDEEKPSTPATLEFFGSVIVLLSANGLSSLMASAAAAAAAPPRGRAEEDTATRTALSARCATPAESSRSSAPHSCRWYPSQESARHRSEQYLGWVHSRQGTKAEGSSRARWQWWQRVAYCKSREGFGFRKSVKLSIHV